VSVTPSLLVAAVLVGPLMGWTATSFAVTARLSRRRPTGWKLIVLPVTFAAVGVLGAFFPSSSAMVGPRDGRLRSRPAALLLIALAVMKYVATAVSLGRCDRRHAAASVAIGAALGAAAAAGWALIWPERTVRRSPSSPPAHSSPRTCAHRSRRSR
jgi:CIC family chloride channel protein